MPHQKILCVCAAVVIACAVFPLPGRTQLLFLEMEDYLERAAGTAIRGLALDDVGSVYLTGYTRSAVFPCRNAYQPRLAGGRDAFIAKLSPEGGLLWSTYFGGEGDDRAYGIAVHGSGGPVIVGMTNSDDFPSRDAYQDKRGGGYDAFVARFSPCGGDLLYATYLGGGGDEAASGIALGPDDDIYVSGVTLSKDFPTRRPYQAANPGEESIFLTRLSPDGSTLVFSTYFGGSRCDSGGYLGLGPAGDIYLAGSTASDDFPARAAFAGEKSGEFDVFVSRLDPAAGELIYSTYLGGAGIDFARGLAVSRDGDAWVAGWTLSEDFPEKNPALPREDEEGDAFIFGLSPSGSELLFSGCFGTPGIEQGLAISLGASGGVYLAGISNSARFPRKNPFQPTWGGHEDVFLIKLNPPNFSLAYSTYLGGGEYERPGAIAVGPSGAIYVAGLTYSFNFPVKNALQRRLSGWSDGFISKLSPDGSELIFSTYLGGQSMPLPRKPLSR